MLPETAFEPSGPFEALRVLRPTAAEAADLIATRAEPPTAAELALPEEIAALELVL